MAGKLARGPGGKLCRVNGKLAVARACATPCDYCSGSVPDEMQVRFTGVTERSPQSECSDGLCASFWNDTFILAKVTPCLWTYESENWPCANCDEGEWTKVYIDVYWTRVGNDYCLMVGVRECPCTSHTTDTCGGGLLPHFYKSYGATKPPCTFTEEVELTSGNGFAWMCDGRISSGARCFVSVA